MKVEIEKVDNGYIITSYGIIEYTHVFKTLAEVYDRLRFLFDAQQEVRE